MFSLKCLKCRTIHLRLQEIDLLKYFINLTYPFPKKGCIVQYPLILILISFLKHQQIQKTFTHNITKQTSLSVKELYFFIKVSDYTILYTTTYKTSILLFGKKNKVFGSIDDMIYFMIH